MMRMTPPVIPRSFAVLLKEHVNFFKISHENPSIVTVDRKKVSKVFDLRTLTATMMVRMVLPELPYSFAAF